jgi:hypothetical protein
VENRPGGNGNIAAEAGVRAPADGYALLMVSSANAATAAFYDKLRSASCAKIAARMGCEVIKVYKDHGMDRQDHRDSRRLFDRTRFL